MKLKMQMLAILGILAGAGLTRPAQAASLADLYQFTGGVDGAN